MRSVLLTGFGPFPGVALNATGVLVPRLAREARRRFSGVAVHRAILPTEWGRGPARARAAYERAAADISIHFGVSGRAQGFVIERLSENVCLQSKDGAGKLPPLEVLDVGGPERRAVTLPVAAILAKLKAMALPAAASDDAGSYLCNAVLYQSLGLKSGLAGFVHLPASLGDTGPLTFEQALAGSLEIIAVCLDEAARGALGGSASKPPPRA
ncbi:MAG: pyroglutamyl-peptidase I [Hyphomicrobiaceae bacterium]